MQSVYSAAQADWVIITVCFIIVLNRAIGLMTWVFANGRGDRGSFPDWVIPKTQKMVLDAALRYTQHYKVHIKGKVEQSREWSSDIPYT